MSYSKVLLGSSHLKCLTTNIVFGMSYYLKHLIESISSKKSFWKRLSQNVVLKCLTRNIVFEMSYSNVLLNEHIIRNVLFKMSYWNVLQYEHIIPKVLFKKSCSKCLIKKVLFETSYSYVENVTLETSSSEEEVKIRRSRDDQRASVLL